jgi:Raf kinase inhibitor-like YbhB/YbcL family protein
MRLYSNSLKDRQPIPEPYAFGLQDPERHVRLGQNLSPHMAWDGLPKGTQSLVLICHDPDVPSRPDDVNQAGRQVLADLPRVDFYHWVLVDIPPTLSELREAEFSQGITPHGKKGPHAPQHMRQGLNDYTGWFSGDKAMEGFYYGYDGPCPPWNDSIPHRYIFTLYALDVDRCPLDGTFTGKDVLQAMAGHVLDQASLQTSYSLNPRVEP